MFRQKGCVIAVILCMVLASMMFLVKSHAQAETSLKAEPATAELNPQALAAVKIKGSGFKPEDRIMIVLAGADKGKDIPVGAAEADAAGSFETTMNMLSILQGIFHFKFQDGKPAPDPSNPPLSPGTYKIKAASWDSKLEALCNIDIKAPEKK